VWATGKLGECVRSDGRKDPCTNRDRVVDVLRFDGAQGEVHALVWAHRVEWEFGVVWWRCFNQA